MNTKVRIRYANSNDLQEVYALVKALAIFEKAPNAVTSTLQDYQHAFNNESIGIIVAESEDKILGMALYYNTFSTWKGKMLYLEDFIVKEESRGHGIGKLLFDAVIKEAHLRNCTMMKWQVLDWNTGAIKFYKQYDTRFDNEWIDCKLYF